MTTHLQPASKPTKIIAWALYIKSVPPVFHWGTRMRLVPFQVVCKKLGSLDRLQMTVSVDPSRLLPSISYVLSVSKINRKHWMPSFEALSWMLYECPGCFTPHRSLQTQTYLKKYVLLCFRAKQKDA